MITKAIWLAILGLCEPTPAPDDCVEYMETCVQLEMEADPFLSEDVYTENCITDFGEFVDVSIDDGSSRGVDVLHKPGNWAYRH